MSEHMVSMSTRSSVPMQVDPQVLLANRIQYAADAIDRLRARNPYSAEEYAEVAKGIGELLAVLDELERLWEALYGERPSRLDVTRAIQAGEHPATDIDTTLRSVLADHASCDYGFDLTGPNVVYACGVTFPTTGMTGLVEIGREHIVRAMLASDVADRLRDEGWQAAVAQVYEGRFRETVGEGAAGFPHSPYRAQPQETL